MLDGSAFRFHTSCLGILVSLIITPPFTPSNGSACLFCIGCVGGAGYGASISQGSAVQGYATFLWVERDAASELMVHYLSGA